MTLYNNVEMRVYDAVKKMTEAYQSNEHAPDNFWKRTGKYLTRGIRGNRLTDSIDEMLVRDPYTILANPKIKTKPSPGIIRRTTTQLAANKDEMLLIEKQICLTMRTDHGPSYRECTLFHDLENNKTLKLFRTNALMSLFGPEINISESNIDVEERPNLLRMMQTVGDGPQ